MRRATVDRDTFSSSSAPDWVEGAASAYAATTSRNTTGQLTWDASRRLFAFLRASDAWRPTRGRARALELGSGAGWLACALGRHRKEMGVEEVVASETPQGGALEWLRARTAANAAYAGGVEGFLTCEALDWEAFARDVEASGGRGTAAFDGFDVVFGADLVYDEAGTKALPRVVAALLARNPEAKFWYAHTKHRYDGMDCDFFDELAARGLACREVREDGCPSPPPSPPPFASLFPDQRIAVYEISLPRAAATRGEANVSVADPSTVFQRENAPS